MFFARRRRRADDPARTISRLAPFALAAFIALVVPAILFVGAFAIACTTILWTPLFQFLFVGYMLWTSLNVTDIPTLSGTLLSPYP